LDVSCSFTPKAEGFHPSRLAFRALALLGPRFELAFVRVRFMTIIAISNGSCRLKSLFNGTPRSRHGVLFRGIGYWSWNGRIQGAAAIFSIRRCMTFSQRCLKELCAIDMAVDAGLELHVPVACRTARHIRLMTLLAFNLM